MYTRSVPAPLLTALALAALLALPLLACRDAGRAGGPGVSTGGQAAGQRLAPRPMPAQTRGIWVTRYDYRYPDDIRTIMRNCAQLGCNTVYWQVRGAGTVCYRSQIEPWGPEFDFRDPGFDPLSLAVSEAHRYGLRIEAWVNLLPGWRGPAAPPMPEQLWNAHPEWFLHDSRGNRQLLGEQYAILNPCLPEVRQYLVHLIDELLGTYTLDGVHLDYVRYAWDTEPNAAAKYPRDRRTLALYQRDTGLRPDDDAEAWRNWRINQLTRLVADIRAACDRRRPGGSLTAAVIDDPNEAFERYFQNGVAWVRTGMVDALLPMAYTERLSEFERCVGNYRTLLASRRSPAERGGMAGAAGRSGGNRGGMAAGRIIPAVGVYKHGRPDDLRLQLARCAEWGGDFALYSYAALCPTHADRGAGGSAFQKNLAQQQSEREMRISVLREFAR